MPGSDLPEEPAFPYSPTDAPVDAGRFNIWQDISLPFQAGRSGRPLQRPQPRLYTQDLSGDDQGRVYGGGGLR